MTKPISKLKSRPSQGYSSNDCMAPIVRFKAMKANRGRTKPEKAVASALWRLGFRFLTADGYRNRHKKGLPGSPDIIFTKLRALIFVDGCLWHGCEQCHDFERDFNAEWQAKIARNVERDKSVRAKLRHQGWHVYRVWEHDLRKTEQFDRALARLETQLRHLQYTVADETL